LPRGRSGLLLRRRNRDGITLDESFLVGTAIRDMGLGPRSLRTILIATLMANRSDAAGRQICIVG